MGVGVAGAVAAHHSQSHSILHYLHTVTALQQQLCDGWVADMGPLLLDEMELACG